MFRNQIGFCFILSEILNCILEIIYYREGIIQEDANMQIAEYICLSTGLQFTDFPLFYGRSLCVSNSCAIEVAGCTGINFFHDRVLACLGLNILTQSANKPYTSFIHE